MQQEEQAFIHRDRDAADAAAAQQKAAAQAGAYQQRVQKERIQLRTHAQQREYEAQGINSTVDPTGRVVAKIDPMTGKPDTKALTGPTQYDATGRAYQMTNKDGAMKQDYLDAEAPIKRNEMDPTDRNLYRQNKQQKWDAIDPEQAILEPDQKLRTTAAAHLMDLEKGELAREKTKLAIELRN